MIHLDTFSGIGCFSMAAEYVWQDDYEVHSFVEWDKFKQKWLKANWPGVPIHDDADTYKHDGTAIDLLTGGPPCQPVSIAGKRKGDSDDRWKWPAMLRIIQDVQPKWIIFENVYGLVNFNGGLLLDGVCLDMEDAGYEVFPPFIIPACSQNAPHRRDRVWVVGHAEGFGERIGQQERVDRELLSQTRRKQGCDLFDTSGESGMGDTIRQGLEGHSGNETRGNEPGRNGQEPDRPACPTGLCGMADTENANRRPGKRGAQEGIGEKDQRRRGSGKRGNSGMEYYTYEPVTEKGRIQRGWKFSGISCDSWSDSEWITGHDGKQRRVKPGVRLLVNGYPNRNDLLRCFGEAIVWQTVVPIMQAIKELDENHI